MQEFVKSLLKLQENYDEINRCNRILKDGSNIYLLKKMKAEFENTKKKYVEKSNSLEKIKKDLLGMSNTMSLEKKRLQAKEDMIETLDYRDHKRVEEHHSCTETIKAAIKKLEDDSLMLMEQEEEINIEKERLRLEIINIKTNFYAKKEEANNEILAAQKNIDAAKVNIENMIKDIPEEVINIFNGILAKKGTAVAKLESGMCSGCRMKVSSLTMDSVYKKEDIVFCNNCGRILYYNI